jgi:heme A synthase
MEIIHTLRQANVTTSHVVVGALLLALTFLLTWLAYRDRIENAAWHGRLARELRSPGTTPVAEA